MNQSDFSIIVPVYNEADAIESTVKRLLAVLHQEEKWELILVNDGSTDGTGAILIALEKMDERISVLTHTKNSGYGKALKTGIKSAQSENVIITDADGTYPIESIPELLSFYDAYDMVVGARTGEDVSYPFIKKIPKFFLRLWIRYLTQSKVPDFNSGLRVFHRSVAEDCWDLLPNGFSFTTTTTMHALFTNKKVKFFPISYYNRIGKSKIHPIKDTLRFFRLVSRLGFKFVPLRLLLPFLLVFIALLGYLL